MKKFTLLDGAALVVWLLPAVYLLSIYSSLPQIVPVHYGLNGVADRYGNKNEILLTAGVLLGLSVFVYLLFKFLPAIDPKKRVKYGEATFRKMALGLVIFIAVLNIAIMYATVHRGFEVAKLVYPVTGLLFVFMGNIMNSIKPNYFFGFRTPWALENEDNWRATHRLAGRLLVAGGLVITVVTFVLPPQSRTIAFISGVAVLVVIPFVYSYRYFKKQHSNQHS